MKLKILLYGFFVKMLSPAIWHEFFYDYFISHLPQDKFEVKFLMSEDEYIENKEFNKNDMLNLVPLKNDDINYIFDNKVIKFHELFVKTNQNKLSKQESLRLKEIYNKIFKDWEPDIILCHEYINSKNIWGDIFPNALCLIGARAIFFRPPFAKAFVYDPISTIPESCATKFADEIKKYRISSRQNLEIEKFKKDFRKIFNNRSLVDKEMKQYKRKFKKIALLPLVGTTHNMMSKDGIFEKDRDIVEYVLKNISSDVGVVVTRHPYSHDFCDDDIEYFRNNYKNFIFLQKTNNIGDIPISLNYYKYVDAILNVTSKVGIEAGLIYDKPVISLAKQYNNLIKDGDDVKDIENIIKKRKKINKNNILYWYLTHYMIYEQSLDKKLYDIITRMLHKYQKNGIDFNFFEQEYTMEEVYDYVIRPLNKLYKIRTLKEKYEYFKMMVKFLKQ